jgi:transcriptional regulator with XRE-family HTH domain
MGVREWRDVRRSELAEAAGLDPSSITLYEQGRSLPSEGVIAKLAAFLRVTPAYLRYGVVTASGEPEIIDPKNDRRLTDAELDRADAQAAKAATRKTRKQRPA